MGLVPNRRLTRENLGTNTKIIKYDTFILEASVLSEILYPYINNIDIFCDYLCTIEIVE